MEIGKTRFGTVIEYKPNQAIDEFSAEFNILSDGDKFDVFCMYQWLIVRVMPKKDNSPSDYNWWVFRLEAIEEVITEDCQAAGKLETKTTTSYELVQLGKNMVNNFWRQS